MTAFVILHYRAINNTHSCIDYIRQLSGEKHIVVVDNASPDGTGLQLYREYLDAPDVSVILSSENAGFARGNNLGIRWACEHLSPDFVVALNDDVEISQRDFIPKLCDIYNSRPFDILGPDIISVFSGIHQSPKRLHGYDLAAVRRKQAYVQRSLRPVNLLLSCGQKNSPTVWRFFQRQARKKQHIDSTTVMEGVVLHGSCVIFSRRYLKRYSEPFFPGTFMYFEMEILDWLCRRDGSVVRYDPALQVIHYQYVATKMEFRSIFKRSKFVINCLLESLKAAETLMLSYGEGGELKLISHEKETGSQV